MKYIHYQVMQETNIGTATNPIIKKELHNKTLGPMSDHTFEENYATAVAEAYNGVVSVTDEAPKEK